MNYAQRRQEAAKWIEIFIEKVKVADFSTIAYNINQMYGLGEFFIKKHLIILQNVGLIKYDDKLGVVHHIGKTKFPSEIKEEVSVEFFLKEQQHTPIKGE